MKKSDNKTSEIKVRLTQQEKEQLKALADDVGLSMSDYIRSIIFSKDKLVLLTEGSEIAKSMFWIRTELESIRNNESVSEQFVDTLVGTLDDVSENLYSLTEKLSDIHTDSEETNIDE